jgi:hypothetical protein
MRNNFLRFYNRVLNLADSLNKIFYLFFTDGLFCTIKYIDYAIAHSDYHEAKRKVYLYTRFKKISLKQYGHTDFDVNKLSYQDLQDMYYYHRFFGTFLTALSYKIALAQKKINNNPTMANFYLGLEAGISSHTLLNLQVKLPKLLLTPKPRAQQQLYDIIHGGHGGNNIVSKTDSMFSHDLNDKKILIVGPLLKPETSEKKCKEFDVVISPNYYKESEIFSNNNTSGVQISYYNNYRLRERLPEVVHACENLQWAVVRSGKASKKLLENLKGDLKTKVRVSSFPHIFNFTDLMGLQRILVDLLTFQDSDIHISNFTFYCSEGSDYSPGYKPQDVAQDVATNLNDLRQHEAIGNYSFVKFLYETGLVTCDDGTRSILEMDVRDYAEMIDKKFQTNDGLLYNE